MRVIAPLSISFEQALPAFQHAIGATRLSDPVNENWAMMVAKLQ
jgi:hypothetical protein